MRGLFSRPISGMVFASLCETKPRKLELYVCREAYLQDTSYLYLQTWGPGRISPGQTIHYIIHVENSGTETAENVRVIEDLPSEIEYVSNTREGIYLPGYNRIIWDVGDVPAQQKICLTSEVRVRWGLEPHTILNNFVYITDERAEIVVDPASRVTVFDVGEATENRLIMTLNVSNEQSTESIYINTSLSPASDEIEPEFYVTEYPDEEEISFRYSCSLSPLRTVQGVIRGSKTALNILKTVKEVKSDVAIKKERERFVNFIYDKGWISESARAGLLSSIKGRFILGGISRVPIWNKIPAGFGTLYQNILGAAKNVHWDFQVGDAIYCHIIENPGQYPIFQDYNRIALHRRALAEFYEYSGSHRSEVRTADDPCLKHGPEYRVFPGRRLDYKVEYENEGEGTAYGVYFTDTLDEDLDDSTLEIGPVIDVNDGSVIAEPHL